MNALKALQVKREEIEGRRARLASDREEAEAALDLARKAAAAGSGKLEAIATAKIRIEAADEALQEIGRELASVDAELGPLQQEVRREREATRLRALADRASQAFEALLAARAEAVQAVEAVVQQGVLGYFARVQELREAQRLLLEGIDRRLGPQSEPSAVVKELRELAAGDPTLCGLTVNVPGCYSPVSRGKPLEPLPDLGSWSSVADDLVSRLQVVEG